MNRDYSIITNCPSEGVSMRPPEYYLKGSSDGYHPEGFAREISSITKKRGGLAFLAFSSE